jgi:hypothetical protein
VVEAGLQHCGGLGAEVGALIACLGRSDWEEREREIGGTREEPLDGAVSDLGARVHPREGPPWLPLGRVEMEGVAPTMAGEWWRER